MRLIYLLIHPGPQINVAHQMDSDECDKIGHMPVVLCLVFEVLEQQYGYHGRPDLTHHGILVCSDKSLDAQMLFYSLKKAFNLPAGLVERTNSTSLPVSIIRDKLNCMFWRFCIVCSLPRFAAGRIIRAVNHNTGKG